MARERRPTLFRATERIYVTPEGTVVGRGYKGFKRLLVGTGGVLSAAEADRYGLPGMASLGAAYDPDVIPSEHPAAHGVRVGTGGEGEGRDGMNGERDGSGGAGSDGADPDGAGSGRAGSGGVESEEAPSDDVSFNDATSDTGTSSDDGDDVNQAVDADRETSYGGQRHGRARRSRSR
jgi:hypothetical protein